MIITDKQTINGDAMCYGRCPFQKLNSGECDSPSKHKDDINAHCNTDFICDNCGERFIEEEAGDEVGYCVQCSENM